MGIATYFSNKFYEQNSGFPTLGSIYWSPVPEIREVPHILEVTRASPEEHEILEFQITDLGGHHFRSKDILPVKRLNLEDNSELMIFKGKKRPCVVIAIGGISHNDIDSIKHVEQKHQAKHLAKQLYILAPMYSCSTYMERGSFGPVITNRIKALKYPHLSYFPPFDLSQLASNPGSILRLDMAFPTYLSRGSERHEYKVLNEVMDVVRDQFSIMCGIEPSSNFLEIKELLEDSLPEN